MTKSGAYVYRNDHGGRAVCIRTSSRLYHMAVIQISSSIVMLRDLNLSRHAHLRNANAFWPHDAWCVAHHS
eukprot:6190251-Pleurochrysis_carterae.AAC.4